MNLPIAHLTLDASPKNPCLKFSNGDTVALDKKEIGFKRSTSRDLSNSYFKSYFYCASDFLSSTDSSTCRSTATIPSLD